MDNKELDALLERLHQELEGDGTLDDEGRELLQKLAADIQARLGEDTTGKPAQGLIGQLQEWINDLEISHPQLTEIISEIVNSLSNAGI